MHEHITSLVAGNWASGGEKDVTVEAGTAALSRLKALGIGTVVDLTTADGMGAPSRGVEAMVEISKRTGLHIIAASAFYKDPFLPDWVVKARIDELVEFHVREATVGIDGTPIKAGIFGESGSSLHEVTPNEDKCFRAVARAHKATGLPISTHCTLGTMALEQAQLFREEGVDFKHLILGHLDLNLDVSYVEAVLATGVTIGFDTIGKEWFDYVVPGSEGKGEGHHIKWAYNRPDSARVANLAALVKKGYDKQIVLSLDLSGYETFLNRATIGSAGYSFLQEEFLPAAAKQGIAPQSVHRMLVENPARVLALD